MRVARTGEAYDRRNRLHYNFLDTRYPLFPNAKMSSEAMYRGYLMKKVNYHDKLVHKLLKELPENAVFFGATEGQVKVLKEAQQLSKKGYADEDWEKAATYMRRRGDALAPPVSVKGPVEYERWLQGKVDGRDREVVQRLMQFHPKVARLKRVYAEKYDLDEALGWEDALKVYGKVNRLTVKGSERQRVGDVLEITHTPPLDGLSRVPLAMRGVAEKVFAKVNRVVVAEALGKFDTHKVGAQGYAGNVEIPLGKYGPESGMRVGKDGKVVLGTGRRVTLRDLLFGGSGKGPAYVAMLLDNRHWLLKEAAENPQFRRLVEELDRLEKNPAAMAVVRPYWEHGEVRSPRDLQPHYHDYGQAPRENFMMRWRDANYTEGFATSDPWEWQARAHSQERVAFYSQAVFDSHVANLGDFSRHQHYGSRRGERRAYNDPYVREALRMQRESQEARDFLQTVLYNPYTAANFANTDEEGNPLATLRGRQGLQLGRGVNLGMLPKGFYARTQFVRGKSGRYIDLGRNPLVQAAVERNMLKWKDYLDKWNTIDRNYKRIMGGEENWERFAHLGIGVQVATWKNRSRGVENAGGTESVYDFAESEFARGGEAGYQGQVNNARSREELEEIQGRMKEEGLDFNSEHPVMVDFRKTFQEKWNSPELVTGAGS